MKTNLVVAVIVFGVSMFCGLVIVANGVLAGRYETLFPYTEKDVCAANEKLVLEQATSTTGGTVTIDGVSTDAGFTENLLYCVNLSTDDKHEVTDEAYAAVEKFKTRIGWWATFGFFLVTMILFLVFQPLLLKTFDRIIGYKPPEGK